MKDVDDEIQFFKNYIKLAPAKHTVVTFINHLITLRSIEKRLFVPEDPKGDFLEPIRDHQRRSGNSFNKKNYGTFMVIVL